MKKKIVFLHIIKNLKTPASYVSSLKKRIHSDGEMKGLK
jgi:hypothetical protein